MLLFTNFKEQDCIEALELWRNTPGIHLHENGEDSLEGIQSYVRRNSTYSFVARDGQTLVGAVICGHDGRRGLIHHLAVRQSYQRQGIGTHLLELSLSALKKDGIAKCALFTLKTNTESEKFYQAQGWSKEDVVNVYSKIL